MAQIGEIKAGDWVANTKEYQNLDHNFKRGPLRVLRVEENTLNYAGNAFVYVKDERGKEHAFYIIALEKYNKQ